MVSRIGNRVKENRRTAGGCYDIRTNIRMRLQFVAHCDSLTSL